MNVREKKEGPSESFVMGVVALVFLVIGYQTALFIHHASVTKIAAGRDEPDTVYVYVERPSETQAGAGTQQVLKTERHNSVHSSRADAIRRNVPRPKTESFRFDPNTVSVDDLCRLGFSMKQAESIDNYRKKGGRFRRKDDFARSFVVADSVYRRLESFIDIPLVDLNIADSAAFDALPGIGGWFATKILEHRKALRGYSYKEQLMDIYRFDQDKFDALSDLVTVDSVNVTPYPLWTLPADSLRLHPYIGNYETAKAIVLYRDNNPKSARTVSGLASAGILSPESAQRLSRCFIAE
ncbi:MAG: helix-hairpin-helix domain-containing protein [Bacteroidales bacterium]|nr:helix-hairpin-helix domain-containing protein [Bacteroidales bacterium]